LVIIILIVSIGDSDYRNQIYIGLCARGKGASTGSWRNRFQGQTVREPSKAEDVVLYSQNLLIAYRITPPPGLKKRTKYTDETKTESILKLHHATTVNENEKRISMYCIVSSKV
jgi:hypothetical protein